VTVTNEELATAIAAHFGGRPAADERLDNALYQLVAVVLRLFLGDEEFAAAATNLAWYNNGLRFDLPRRPADTQAFLLADHHRGAACLRLMHAAAAGTEPRCRLYGTMMQGGRVHLRVWDSNAETLDPPQFVSRLVAALRGLKVSGHRDPTTRLQENDQDTRRLAESLLAATGSAPGAIPTYGLAARVLLRLLEPAWINGCRSDAADGQVRVYLPVPPGRPLAFVLVTSSPNGRPLIQINQLTGADTATVETTVLTGVEVDQLEYDLTYPGLTPVRINAATFRRQLELACTHLGAV
jgi:hypothetical protein